MSQEQFEVQRIIDYRIRKGKEEYQVQWKGFHNDQRTWQPIENLTTCIDMVKEFKTQQGLHSDEEQEIITIKHKNRKSKPDDEGESAQFETLPQRPKLKNPQKKKNIVPKDPPKKVPTTFDKKQVKKAPLIEDEQQNQNWFQPQQDNPIIIKKDEKHHTKGELVIEKMLTDEQKNIYFEVKVGGEKVTLPRQKVMKDNITALLSFYEKYISLRSKQSKA